MTRPEPDASQRVGALLFRRVGDSLLATPAIRALKKGLPNIRLEVYAEPQVVRVFRNNPWIDEIVEVDKPDLFHLAATLRRGRPAAAIDFLSDPRSACACYLSRAAVRAGFGYALRRHLYTVTISPQNPEEPLYSAEHKLGLARALGCKDDGIQTEFYLSHEDREFAETIWAERGWNGISMAAFFVHSRRDYKRWPLKYFAEVIEHLAKRNHITPLVLSTPDDDDAIQTLSTLTRLHRSQVLELRDLGHLGAVLAKCAVLIGNDGGPKHLAVASDTPSVTVFRNEDARFWTPPVSKIHRSVCAPPAGSIADAPVSAMIEAVEELLPSVVKC